MSVQVYFTLLVPIRGFLCSTSEDHYLIFQIQRLEGLSQLSFLTSSFRGLVSGRLFVYSSLSAHTGLYVARDDLELLIILFPLLKTRSELSVESLSVCQVFFPHCDLEKLLKKTCKKLKKKKSIGCGTPDTRFPIILLKSGLGVPSRL